MHARNYFYRWSKIKPVPELGDNDTPHEKVMEFYDFWLSFKSWRTFSGSEEYNPEEAESRFAFRASCYFIPKHANKKPHKEGIYRC